MQLHRNDYTSLAHFESIKEEDLTVEINKISFYKSSGIKHIPSYLSKHCFKFLNLQLVVIMNKSLLNGYFPLKWRKTIIVPIANIPVPAEIGDLRPIALTPLPGKMLEHFVHT